MVFGKGLDAIPQALVEKQRAGYAAEQAELTAKLSREARREELMNAALQGIASQGMSDILGRQKEARDWGRKQEELSIKEEMVMRQEARAEERGINAAERKRMAAIEEEVTKLSALTEEEVQATAVIEILSGVRTQYASNRTPVTSGGNNVQAEVKSASLELQRLKGIQPTNPETKANLESRMNNLSNKLLELDAEANESQRLEQEAGERAKGILFASQSSGAGLSASDRNTLFGPNGYVTRLAKQKVKTAKKLIELRLAQYEALRLRQGGPQLPESLRRQAALNTESVGATAAQKAAQKQVGKSANRPGRQRKQRNNVLPQSSNTSPVSENDARLDAVNLYNLNQSSTGYFDDPAPPVYGQDPEASHSAPMVSGPASKREVANKLYLDLRTSNTVRVATGFGNPLRATATMEEAQAEERKGSQAGIESKLKKMMMSHNALGKSLKFAMDSAANAQIDIAYKFLMTSPAYQRVVEGAGADVDIPPNMVADLQKRAQQMFTAFSGSDVESFVEQHPNYRSAYNSMKGSKTWSKLMDTVTIKDVMAYQMMKDVAHYMDSNDIREQAAKSPLKIEGVLNENGVLDPNISPEQGMNMASVLNMEALAAARGLPGWEDAFYAVAAGRANYGSRSGRASSQWGAGGNGMQFRSVLDTATSSTGIASAYTSMLQRARKEGKTLKFGQGNNQYKGLVISYQNYNTFRATVRSLMQKSMSKNSIWQTLVHIGRR